MNKPYISLDAKLPGILALLAYNTDTGLLISQMAEDLLHNPKASTLEPGVRELLFAYTSLKNNCTFCTHSHAHIAAEYIGMENVMQAFKFQDYSGMHQKVKALLHLVATVAEGGNKVNESDVNDCRQLGCTDSEVHDAVQIAAFACMCNRYVDGLGTVAPPDGDPYYREAAQAIHKNGYLPQISLPMAERTDENVHALETEDAK